MISTGVLEGLNLCLDEATRIGVEFLKHFGYKHHLRKLREELQARQNQMMQAVGQKFPRGTHLTRPEARISCGLKCRSR